MLMQDRPSVNAQTVVWLTVFSFITPKVSPVAEHDLQVVALIQSSQDSQQQQDDSKTTSQLQPVHI